VRHGGKTVEITDHGTPVAVVIPIELLDYFQHLEDARDLAAAEESKAQSRRRVSHAEVVARFGLNPDGTPKL
jgi:prevent-host-death family protein